MKYAIPATESNKRMGQILHTVMMIESASVKIQAAHTPVEMMRAWPVGLMLALAHGSIRTLAS